VKDRSLTSGSFGKIPETFHSLPTNRSGESAEPPRAFSWGTEIWSSTRRSLRTLSVLVARVRRRIWRRGKIVSAHLVPQSYRSESKPPQSRALQSCIDRSDRASRSLPSPVEDRDVQYNAIVLEEVLRKQGLSESEISDLAINRRRYHKHYCSRITWR
jgi:hypothetical protein